MQFCSLEKIITLDWNVLWRASRCQNRCTFYIMQCVYCVYCFNMKLHFMKEDLFTRSSAFSRGDTWDLLNAKHELYPKAMTFFFSLYVSHLNQRCTTCSPKDACSLSTPLVWLACGILVLFNSEGRTFIYLLVWFIPSFSWPKGNYALYVEKLLVPKCTGIYFICKLWCIVFCLKMFCYLV